MKGANEIREKEASESLIELLKESRLLLESVHNSYFSGSFNPSQRSAVVDEIACNVNLALNTNKQAFQDMMAGKKVSEILDCSNYFEQLLSDPKKASDIEMTFIKGAGNPLNCLISVTPFLKAIPMYLTELYLY